jgi:uncharacterized protein YjiS (DUF1127 family)
MSCQSSSSAVLSAPLRGPAAARRVNVFRMIVALYRTHLERRRQRRAFEGIAEMNDYLLKDIGALDWLISRGRTRIEAPHPTRFEIGR